MGEAAYATPEDLRAQPGCSGVANDVAKRFIAYVSRALDRLCDTSEVPADLLSLVTCRACARMLQSGDSAAGVQSESWGASPYSGSVTYANPTGDIYLTAFEKRLLGVDEPWAGYVSQGAPDA